VSTLAPRPAQGEEAGGERQLGFAFEEVGDEG